MKKYFLTMALAAVAFSGFAQSEKLEKGIITLNLSSAAPTGSFADDKEGIATSGGYVGLEYNHFFNNYFGAGVTFGSRTNALDVDSYAKLLGDAGLSGQVTGTSYTSGFILANAIAKYHVSAKFVVYGKGSFGSASSSTPEIEFTGTGGSAKITSAKSSALAYGFGAGARYSLGKIALGLEFMNLSTNPEFEIDNEKFDQEMNSMNVGLTVSYVFK